MYLIFTISPACGEHGLKGEHVVSDTLVKYFTPPGVTPTLLASILVSATAGSATAAAAPAKSCRRPAMLSKENAAISVQSARTLKTRKPRIVVRRAD